MSKSIKKPQKDNGGLSERLTKLIEVLRSKDATLKSSGSSFAGKIGVARSTISNCISKGTYLTGDTFMKIKEAYPYVNIAWLQFNEGEMFVEPAEKKIDKETEIVMSYLIKRLNYFEEKESLYAKTEK